MERQYRKHRVDAAHDEMAQDQAPEGSGNNSAMVIVLGLVSLLSLIIGFILGKIF